MERIVYILGAGFSAPLGLPVMRNFFEKAQGLYLEDRERFARFSRVFDEVTTMSKTLNYYRADLRNIEEILSILEMSEYLKGSRLEEDFKTFIIDVIEQYTPPLVREERGYDANWPYLLFPRSSEWAPYGYFVAALLNLKFIARDDQWGQSFYETVRVENNDPNPTRYSVISLNYDLVLENAASFIVNNYAHEGPVNTFRKSLDGFTGADSAWDYSVPFLAKLHGSVDTRVIVPPTWSKGANTEIVPQWNLALNLLEGATQIRVIGYSLAPADAYVKYLIKSAALKSDFLKRFDVICFDPSGWARGQYADFVSLNTFRFANADVRDYLDTPEKLPLALAAGGAGACLALNHLEAHHDDFMRSSVS